MKTGNKGEWSEFYAFVKILVERKLFGADENLEKVQSIVFPVLEIIREQSNGISKYDLREDDKVAITYVDGRSTIIDSINLRTKVVEIFSEIKTGSKTFSVQVAEDLFEKLDVETLNAGSSRKEDLVLQVHDFNIGINHEVGFSVKSKIGSPATLLNASAATNFTYKISWLDKKHISAINSIKTKSKVRDRLAKIQELGGAVDFLRADSNVFEKNLRKIDTALPEIMAKFILAYYCDKGSTFPELVQNLGNKDIRISNFDLSAEDCAYKMKSLLNNVALGMVPGSAWDGNLRAHGGVIIVREDGELVCYHLYNADAFRNYLFNNTRLETPSTTRHRYGIIYEESGELFFKLNLQIRFVK